MFKKKLVTIGKTNHTCILLQNENGPCSLISIGKFFIFDKVNVLLIRNSDIVSTIPRNEKEISQEYILSILVDFLLKKVKIQFFFK
jgi:ubiquitin carboxyl-terminal hydrolase MINDY-1/2